MSLNHPREAAKRLKKHHSTIHPMIERGDIEFEQVVVEKKFLRVLWDATKRCLVLSRKPSTRP